MTITTCIFDAYGTLFDVTSAAQRAAHDPEFSRLAQLWPQLAQDWRAKQLEYSWLRAIMGDHTPFWTVTMDALDWALARAGLEDDPPLRARLLQLYQELSAYPEVPIMLQTLKDKGFFTAILSNGSHDMLDAAVSSAGLDRLLDDVLSVDTVGIFKPSDQVYQMVPDRFQCARDEVLFVSSNGWDIAGAARFGFVTAWVNRAALPVDRMPGQPAHILSDLTQIPEIAAHA